MVASHGLSGRLSAHFTADEFLCPHCGAAFISPVLVAVLERIRSRAGRALVIRSGYRCPIHNAAVGGASDSQHVYGRAADIPGLISADQAERAGAVGIGTKNGLVVHVDVREGPPARWTY